MHKEMPMTTLLETLFGVTKDNPYDSALARIDEEIARVKLGLATTDRPTVHDTIPAPAPDFGELELPVPECPPTLDALPDGPENDQPEPEAKCHDCNGSGLSELGASFPSGLMFPPEYYECDCVRGKR